MDLSIRKAALHQIFIPTEETDKKWTVEKVTGEKAASSLILC